MPFGLLETLRVQSTVHGRLELRAPWGTQLGNVSHAAFYVLTGGSGWLQLEGHPAPVRLQEGSFAFVRKGQGYVIRDSLDSAIVPLQQVFRSLEPDTDGVMRGGGEGALTTAVFGCFGFEDGDQHPLVASLPALLVRHAGEDPTVEWVDASLKLMAASQSSLRPRSGAFECRVAEALLIHVFRAHFSKMPEAPGIAPLLDPHVARALGLIHEQPGERWTVDSLASSVGLSRTAFATRFAALVGEPPLRYVTGWRMRAAARLLRETDQGLAQIADRVGYEAEEAFSRAFKRWAGVAPGTFRRRSAGGQAPT